jgi:hypothetical protein
MKEFDYADFVSEERVVPDEKLGKYNIPFIVFPFTFLFIFIINHGTAGFMAAIDDFFSLQNLFLVFSAGFLFHEMLHFMAWQALTGFKIQDFRLGMRWNSFTPVICCQRPMAINAFRFGLIFPFIVMGIGPMIFAFYNVNTWFLFAGSIYMAWASADILTFILLWNVSKKSFVEMHRIKLGSIVFNPKEQLAEFIG